MGDLGKKVEHEILIKPTHNNGFIVTIGCRQFSYEGPNNMLKDLRRYLDDPEGKERELNNALRHKQEEQLGEEPPIEERPGSLGPGNLAEKVQAPDRTREITQWYQEEESRHGGRLARVQEEGMSGEDMPDTDGH